MKRGLPLFLCPLLGALYALFLAMAGVGCGGSTTNETVHRVPGYEFSVALPSSWDVVNHQSSAEELDRFEREHPRFFGTADTLRSRSGLAAAEKPGDVRLLVSIDEAEPGYMLARHIERNLPALEEDSPGLGVKIHGARNEIVEFAGGDAWRIRWSFDGDLGRNRLVQYTAVRDGLLYLLTYSTLQPWDEAEGVFAASADSVEIGGRAEVETSAASGLIAFTGERGADDEYDVYVVDAAGGSERRLTRTGTDSEPAWSPDGMLIAFTSNRDGNSEIYVMQADGSDQRRLTTSDESDGRPSWSPDGSLIMFTRGSCDGDGCDLFVMNADGTDVKRLTQGGESADGSWSPDGARIVFWSNRDSVSGIHVMDADGSGLRHLTHDFDTAWNAAWSPDGESIIFVGSRDDPVTGDEDTSIYRMNADGGGATKIASPTGFWIDEPAWSPDGTSIAFFSDGQGPGAIWVMKADGTQQRPVTRSGDSHSPSWQPSSG